MQTFGSKRQFSVRASRSVRMSKQTCVLLLAAFAYSVVSAQGLPPVPCPEYFRYYYDDYSNVNGSIELPYDGKGSLNLHVNASMRGFFGQENSKMRLFLITPAVQILQGSTSTIKYSLSFPIQQSIPKITSIVLNNEEYCDGPPFPDPFSNLTSLHVSHRYPGDISRRIEDIISGVLTIGPEGDDYFYPAFYVDYVRYVDDTPFEPRDHSDEYEP